MDFNVTSKATAAASPVIAGVAGVHHAAEDLIDDVALDAPDAGVAGDARAVMVETNIKGPVSAGGQKTVDFNAAFTQEVAKVLPGAKLMGEWTAEAVHEVAAVLQAIPTPMMFRLQGLEFVYASNRKADDKHGEDEAALQAMQKLILARRTAARRALIMAEEALHLPDVNGQSGFKAAMLRELGMLMNEKPARLEEFGRLSGWTQTVYDQQGNVLEGTRAATGFAPGEPIPGQRPADQPGAPGTQLLTPSETGRLGTGQPVGQGAAPQPRPAASPTKRLTLSGVPSPVGNRGPASGPLGPGGPLGNGGQVGTGGQLATGGQPAPGTPTAQPGQPGQSGQSGQTGRLGQPGHPGHAGRPGQPGLAGSGPLGQPGSGPLGAARPGGTGRLSPETRGPQRLGAPAGPRPGAAPTAKLQAVAVEAVDGGSRVAYSNKTVLQYEHKADARFLPGNAPPADPREDFAEAFQAFMTNPQALLKAAPEKFLFLNAEARQFPPAKVLAMAKEAGVDLTQVVTSMVVGNRASQAMIDRICEFHGIAADRVALLAKDQELLAKSANLDGLVERLALDISANGAATTKLLKAGEQLRDKYHGLVGELPLTREADGVKGGFVSWLVGKATGGDRLARLDNDLAEVRTQFTKLPLAVQLRTDPRLALGANWFALSAQERAMLANPEQLQQLVARAAAKAEDASYIPQNLTPNEKAQLANRTMLEALFDPGSEGAAFRAKLTGPNPRAALEELRAKNGEKVFVLLNDAQKKSLLDTRNAQALRQLLEGEEAAGARNILRDGTTGAEQLKAALLRFQMNDVRQGADLRSQLEGLLGQVKGVRQNLLADLGGSPLEVALTEINRQVQEGNMPFVQKFLNAKGEKGLEGVLGAWVAGALSPAEKKLFEDADYRRHLVQNAEQIRSTGLSLASEARQYKIQTENIQQALEILLRPDNQFREEFARDPVQALKARGLWVNLPDPIQQQLADGERKIKLSQLVQAVQEAMSPVIMRQAGYQKRLDNLKAAIRGVNAGNYMGVLKLLDLSAAEMQRNVKGGLQAAMAGEAEHKAGGPLSFV